MRITALLTGCLALAGCNGLDEASTTGPAPRPGLTVRDLACAGFPADQEAADMVLRNRTELDAWWRMHCDGTAPAVDFDAETVVASALGGRPNTGYAVEVASAEAEGKDAVVRVVETRPGPGCSVGHMVTYPQTVVAIGHVGGEVAFRHESRSRECPPRGHSP